MKFKKIKLGKYFFDFVAVFFAVVSAFALNNWNDNRKDGLAEEKILVEIRNGLKSDLKDLKENRKNAQRGRKAVIFFRDIVYHDTIAQDSMLYYYFALTENSIPLVNKSGYEVLKSKGMEILQNDSLRKKIINMYELEYDTAYSLDSATINGYNEIREEVDKILSKSFYFEKGYQAPLLNPPLKLSVEEQTLFLTYLFRIEAFRYTSFGVYDTLEEKINLLAEEIDQELKENF